MRRSALLFAALAVAGAHRVACAGDGPASAPERAGAGGEWCLSHQVEAGQPVPVSTCLDCGKVAVSVEPPDIPDGLQAIALSAPPDSWASVQPPKATTAARTTPTYAGQCE